VPASHAGRYTRRTKMSFFSLIEITVKDEELYGEYMEKVPEVVHKYKGRYVVRSSRITPVTSDWNPDRIILVEFDTLEDLMKCFTSAEYNKIAPLREQATLTRSIIIEN
jgi:uncharacterized protein (DUF1330 family)